MYIPLLVLLALSAGLFDQVLVVQSLHQSPGFNLLSYYDFRGAAASDDVQYTKRWPQPVLDGEVPCCFPGVSHISKRYNTSAVGVMHSEPESYTVNLSCSVLKASTTL